MGPNLSISIAYIYMIRNHFLFAIAAVMAFVLVPSCANEELSVPDSLEDRIIATMADPTTTKTAMGGYEDGTNVVGILWTSRDQIGVFEASGASQKCYEKTDDSGDKANAAFAVVTGTPAFSQPTYAYYPYNAENDGRDITSLVGSLPNQQNMDNGNLNGDYKYGRVVGSNGQGHKFVFSHLFSMARIELDATNTPLVGQKLKSISIYVKRGNENVNIAGDFTFNATNGEWAKTDNLSNSVTLNWSNGPTLSTDVFTCYASLFPTIMPNDVFTIEVKTANHRAVITATSRIGFNRENIYTFPVTLRRYENIKIYNANGSEVDYKSMVPSINEFSFEVSKNSGKLLNNKLVWNSSNNPQFNQISSLSAEVNNGKDEINLVIPYLRDFKLTPTFSANSNCKVTVNGVEQISGKSEVDFTSQVTYVVTNTSSNYTREYKVRVTNSGIPVVVIKQSSEGNFDEVKTGGVLGIGATTVNKFVNFMVRGKDTDWVESDQISIYYPDGSTNIENAYCGVRLRGNTTQQYPKKPFAIKFKDKQSVLGMPKHKRWVLLANWLDHSMIRNAVAFDIAHTIENVWRTNNSIEPGIPWNVHGYNVELVIDGHHVGNYFLCEQIKIDENRLNINAPYEDVAKNGTATFQNCGYLFELDNNYDEDQKFITSKYSVPFMFKDAVSTDIFNSVKTKVQRIENNIYNGKYADAYTELDINTVIDQWLIWELTMNHEFLDPRSVYYFMNGDGKLSAGPVWDFDRATFQNVDNARNQGSSGDRLKPYNEWICEDASWAANVSSSKLEDYSPAVWYPQLINDATYRKTVKQRWAVLYPYLMDDVTKAIQQYGELLCKSYSCNNEMWPTTKSAIQEHKSNFSDWAGDENIAEWSEVIKNFEKVYTKRLEGMNALINDFAE